MFSRILAKIRRLDITRADRALTSEISAYKAASRREVAELARQGRWEELDALNRRALGIPKGAKIRLVGVAGHLWEDGTDAKHTEGSETAT